MNLSTPAQQRTPPPDFRDYEKFATTPHAEETIAVGLNGHKIQIATKSPDEPKLSSYLAKDGLEYEFSQEEKNAIVDHFKKSLALKYGDVAESLFSIHEEAEALEHGLSHRIVKNVAIRAQLPSLLRKTQSLTESINILEKDDPLFIKQQRFEEAKTLIEAVKNVLSTLGNDTVPSSQKPLALLHHTVNKLEEACLAAEFRISVTREESPSGFYPMPTKITQTPSSSSTTSERSASSTASATEIDRPCPTGGYFLNSLRKKVFPVV
ncbi:MAG: hypothetical protein FJ390_07615 [Verrucomicrobia bacterium]|nr:hypothetical protein [Verrucomicrobiota bacterium]